jgi:hypothetical protein
MIQSLRWFVVLATASAVVLKGNSGKQQAMESGMFSDKVNPIRKVVGMLEDMRGELERERDQEGELFEKAMCACEGGEKDLNKVIADSTGEIARLTSQIEEESAQYASVKKALEEHYANKESATQDLQKATDLRDKESAQFSKESSMKKFSVGALGKAIPQLERGASAASLMQSDDDFSKLRRVIEVTHYITPEERERVLSFMEDDLGEVAGAKEPSAGVAEVVGVLKNMKDNMSKDLADQIAAEKQMLLAMDSSRQPRRRKFRQPLRRSLPRKSARVPWQCPWPLRRILSRTPRKNSAARRRISRPWSATVKPQRAKGTFGRRCAQTRSQPSVRRSRFLQTTMPLKSLRRLCRALR